MAYVTSWERIGQAKGLLDGLAVALDLKFGADGVALLLELRQIGLSLRPRSQAQFWLSRDYLSGAVTADVVNKRCHPIRCHGHMQ